jgi:uncharacterized protein (TIGR00251 family)
VTIPAYLQHARSGEWLLLLWIQPGAKKSGFAGLHGERLKLRLSAAPIEGKANNELIRFLSETLELPGRKFSLIAGRGSRAKTVRVSDVPEETLLVRLQRIMQQKSIE